MAEGGLPKRTLGRTGLQVTRLGYGAMSLDSGRFAPVAPEQANRVLNAVLDEGINFIDTSPDYGESEESIGRYIGHRRSEYFLATKCGCPVLPSAGNRHVYTRENILAAVEQSLRRMRTDHIDLLQLHGSPSPEALDQEGAVDTLRGLQKQGKVRYIGASSVLPDLARLIAAGVFDAFQIPYSALQREHEGAISEAAKAGAGTVVRGGAARGAPSAEKDWAIRRLPEVAPERPRAHWEHARLDDLLEGESRMGFVLRFTFSHPHLDTTIVGTANPEHLRQNIAALRRGPLPPNIIAEAQRRLDSVAEKTP